ncbi:NAD(P)H-hydrate dehydratase [Lacihabitans soyangensis]|uniref:Bifunctional NAD(P)H-hydrate repair enzyme n=1 Tax=Lacihabitans soyangensis TaxID=869394 RepID=A0AAE3H2H6_9BACT|nr:NAD(P)H-hydrate dehydratase [Lacihabitans soyangensis]MCP9763100.1 NAD(P)H-hydrate dehydratase [Lacihabitans soyangensis]
MKILSTYQTRDLDEYTIKNEPIPSIDLMERAAQAFVNSFVLKYDNTFKTVIFCGIGNNGGDGLAVARKLHQLGYDVQTYVLGNSTNGSIDFLENLKRLQNQSEVIKLSENDEFHLPKKEKSVIIDAIFGSGLNRPIDGFLAIVILKINQTGLPIVSIDIASGLFSDTHSPQSAVIQPTYTITFQYPKLAFFQPENEKSVGSWEAVDIGLSQDSIREAKTKYYYTSSAEIRPLARSSFSHKGTFGHAFLVAGSYGMMGAAVLATKACLRSGVGKITTHVPKKCVDILQISVPEVIVDISHNDYHFDGIWNFTKYDAVAMGPGIGLENIDKFEEFLKKTPNKKLIIDADGITFLGQRPELLKLLPKNTILTPHPKEFKSLIGRGWENDFEKLEILSEFAVSKKIIICLKGKNTAVALPNGEIHFNSTGNSGMATAGSGDVLTGIILSFLAQGYPPEQAAIQGVYEHGLAGDQAAKNRSERSMIASDIIENLR